MNQFKRYREGTKRVLNDGLIRTKCVLKLVRSVPKNNWDNSNFEFFYIIKGSIVNV